MMRIELAHPMIVHFPIVLILGLFTLDAMAVAKGWSIDRRGAIARSSTVLALSAGIFAILAFVFGDQAYDIALAQANAPKSAIEFHQEIGTAAAIGLAAWAVVRGFLWWRASKFANIWQYGIIAIEGALVVLVLTAAWYGGELVYNYGVAVTR